MILVKYYSRISVPFNPGCIPNRGYSHQWVCFYILLDTAAAVTVMIGKRFVTSFEVLLRSGRGHFTSIRNFQNIFTPWNATELPQHQQRLSSPFLAGTHPVIQPSEDTLQWTWHTRESEFKVRVSTEKSWRCSCTAWPRIAPGPCKQLILKPILSSDMLNVILYSQAVHHIQD